MKLLALILVAAFTVPAFAKDCEKVTTVSEKNRAEIKKIAFNLKDVKAKSEEEMKDESSSKYRINEIADPNEKKVSKNEKTWSIMPTAGTTRRAIMTPEEKRREDEGAYPGHPENGKYSTFTGSEERPTWVGAKLKVKFGASR